MEILNPAGLKRLLFCRHPTLALRVGSVGILFYLGEGQSHSQGFTAF